MKYMLFYTGLCSTPWTVGLLNVTTGEKIHEISVDCEKSKDSRIKYNKFMDILKRKYESLLN
jgi:hypothetical protein